MSWLEHLSANGTTPFFFKVLSNCWFQLLVSEDKLLNDFGRKMFKKSIKKHNIWAPVLPNMQFLHFKNKIAFFIEWVSFNLKSSNAKLLKTSRYSEFFWIYSILKYRSPYSSVFNLTIILTFVLPVIKNNRQYQFLGVCYRNSETTY